MTKGVRWREGLQVMGPAFLVSVAYLDPGNWATAIESGSRFGYSQLWLLVLSNLIAIHLQALASRLGLATGRHLAEVCRHSYPRSMCTMLWVMTEISIVALDLTMVLGTAIGLNLLFKIPPVTCILLTGVDALAHLLLLPQAGLRHAQQWTACLVAAVLACFVVDLFISRPPLHAVVSGLLPSLHREGIYSAVSLLGANIMPHNFYLHSALVATQARTRDAAHTARLCYLNFVDIACALGLALLVNVAVLLVAASTFHATGVAVATLQDAHDLLEQILNSRLAPLAFGLALLLTGQMSTFTGTIAGQVVLSGFMGVQSSPLTRRLGTRVLAIVPALAVQLAYGAPGTYKMLVVAQVVLALQLPFTLIPLIKATSSRALMGPFASSWLRSGSAWAASFIVSAANLLMLLDMLRMDAPEPRGAAGLTEWSISGGFHQWLQHVRRSFARAPAQFLALCLVTLVAGAAVMLLSWMLVCPVALSDGEPHGAKHETTAGRPSPPTDDPVNAYTRAWDLEQGLADDVSCSSTDGDGPGHRAELRVHVTQQHTPPAAGDANPLKRPAVDPTRPVKSATWPQQVASRVWEAVLTGRWRASADASTPVPQAAPLTQALLTAHDRTSPAAAPQPVWPQRCAHSPRAAAHVDSVPPPLLDWRSAEARRARWLLLQQQLSRSATESDLSLAAEPSIDRSVASSRATVPGGLKGHTMGRSARKQFAGLIAAVWSQHFDKFGMPVAPAEPCVGAVVVVDLCDVVAEIQQIAGSDSLLREWSEGEAAPCAQRGLSPSPSGAWSEAASQWSAHSTAEVQPEVADCAQQPASPCSPSRTNHVAGSALGSTVARKDESGARYRVGALPEPGNTLRAHANAVHAFANCAPAVRVVFETAQRPEAWPAQVAQCSAWQYVLGLQQAAWARSCTALCTCTLHSLCTAQQSLAQHDAAGAELLKLSFGLWCIVALLQLGAVEPRPELWGRYVAALNPLQGVLRAAVDCSLPGHDRKAATPLRRAAAGTGEHEGRGWPAQCRAACTPVLDELSHLVLAVERHVKASGGSGDRAGPAAAFAKGKENLLSVVKRYKALLRPAGAHVQARSHEPAASPRWQRWEDSSRGLASEPGGAGDVARPWSTRAMPAGGANGAGEWSSGAAGRRGGAAQAPKQGAPQGRLGLQTRADRGSWRD